MKLQLLLIAVCVCAASAGIPKKLLKKYAMKKVMESCFGEQLMSDIKQEVEVACNKCHGHQGPEMPQLRDQMTAMLAGAEYASKPAHYAHNVRYVPVPVHYQPVSYQRRYRRSAHGKFTAEKLEMMRMKIASIVGNMTCVLQELKFLDSNNQVDFPSMKRRIMDLPLPKELTDDMCDGLDKCRDFASCIPSSFFEKSPIMSGFGKQLAFFKCFKMVKVESCMKQDFREDYFPALMRSGLDLDSEESFQTIITSALLEEEGGMM